MYGIRYRPRTVGSLVTSVKEIRVDEPPTTTSLGRGRFAFTNDYSVFDWGKMPDPIPAKGASLCTMGAYNFEALHRQGIPTHYRGVIENDTVVNLAEMTAPPREMAIDLTQVPDLPYTNGEYDYDAYHAAAGENYLIPLEIVFRNTVPIGSSLRARTTPPEQGLDFDQWPDAPVRLPEPLVEFSTKYEEQDRYLDRDEANRIAGAAPLSDLERLADRVNDVVTDQATANTIEHHDGKIECLYHRGEVRVADVVGTFDENRFAYNDQQLSKEVLRQYYKRHHPDWVDAVSDAKAAAKTQGVADWRELCQLEPPSLPEPVIQTARDIYAAGANAYTNRDWFDAPALDEAVAKARALD